MILQLIADQQFQHFLNNDFAIPRDQCVALACAKCFLQETLICNGNTLLHELPMTLRMESQRPSVQGLRL